MARTKLAIEIQIESPAWRKAWPNAAREAKRFLSTVAARDDLGTIPVGEVTVVLSDDARVRGLNFQFRGKDRATNVLSFPDVATPLGGIALAFETLESESVAQRKRFVNHVKHMILHGFLHLLEFDHQTTREACLMERLETAILGEMGIPNPYVIETTTRA
jgi:probable rRNA maturation factor